MRARAKRRSRKIRSLLQQPFVSCILLVLLVGDALMLDSEHSTVGGWIARAMSRDVAPLETTSSMMMPIYLTKFGYLVVCMPPPDPAERFIPLYPCEGGELYGQLSWTLRSYHRGFWVPTEKGYSVAVLIDTDDDPPLDEHERAGLRYEASSLLLKEGYDRQLRKAIETGGEVQHDALWLGWLHSAGAMLIALLFVYSLGWAPGSPRRYQHMRRILRGHCPQCNYNLQFNLRVGCSECGWKRYTDSSPIATDAHQLT